MQGYYQDPELEYYFPGERMYDPSTGQFTRVDPIGYEAGDPNLYRYVANNPVNATDPSGLQTKEEKAERILQQLLSAPEVNELEKREGRG